MKKKILSKQQELALIEFYKDHSDRQTAEVFGFYNHIKRVFEILENYNIQRHSKIENQKFSIAKWKTTMAIKPEEEKQASKIKHRQTCLALYGNENYTNDTKKSQTMKQILNTKTEEEKLNRTKKWKATVSKKPAQEFKKWRMQIVENSYKTKRLNNTFNTSKPEELLYSYLSKQYGTQDIIRQYKETRYPFMCDFYIKSIDTFIELNLHWTHGNHLFDKNNKEDIKKIRLWKERSKTSKFYKTALYIWTHRDPIKYAIAKQNNLNFISIYTQADLEQYIYGK